MKTKHVRMFLEDPDEGKLTAHLSYEEDSVSLTLYDANDSIYIGSYIGYGQTQLKELKARAKNEKEKWNKLLNMIQEAADRTSVMFANAIEVKDEPADKVIEKAKKRVKRLLKQDAD